jgi:hypothetical protein
VAFGVSVEDTAHSIRRYLRETCNHARDDANRCRFTGEALASLSRFIREEVKSLKSKKALVLTLVIMLLFSSVSLAFAAPNVNPTANPNLIKSTATSIAQNIVGVVQGVFGVAAVCFVIWAGIMFWGAGGDPQKITMAKKAFAGFIIAMICVFFADKIVGGLLGIFGV